MNQININWGSVILFLTTGTAFKSALGGLYHFLACWLLLIGVQSHSLGRSTCFYNERQIHVCQCCVGYFQVCLADNEKVIQHYQICIWCYYSTLLNHVQFLDVQVKLQSLRIILQFVEVMMPYTFCSVLPYQHMYGM